MNVAFHKLAIRHARRLAPERAPIYACHCNGRRAGLSYISIPKNDVRKAQHRFFSWGKSWQHIQKKYDALLEDSKSKKHPPGHFSLRVQHLLLEMVAQPNHAKMGSLAERLLEAAEEDLIQSKSHAREELRAILYKLTIEAWLRTPGSMKPGKEWDEAENLLWKMLRNGKEAKDKAQNNGFYSTTKVEANVESINGAFFMVLQRFCKGNKRRQQSAAPRQVTSRLEPILKTLQQLWDDPCIPLVPDSFAMDAILFYHLRTRQAGMAHQILQGVIDTKGNKFLRPTIYGINTVISAHAKDGNVEAAKAIILQMLDESNKLPKPTLISFNGLLDAIAQRGGQDAGLQAEEVLNWMTQQLSIHPNTISFGSVISAWARSGHPDTAERAEAILRHSMDLCLSRDTKDIAILFAMVVQTSNTAARAVAIVDLMLNEAKDVPKVEMTCVFNALIMALANMKTKHVEVKLNELLNRMHTMGIPADTVTHNSVMTSLIKSGSDGPEKALGYFNGVETKFNAGDPSSELNTVSFNVALNAISKFRGEDAPKLAMELLQRMRNRTDIEVDSTTYNTVMNVLAKSSLDESALRCEQLLKEMERQPVTSTIRPCAASYSICITAWGHTRSPERFDRMTRLLQRMENRHRSGVRDAQPTAVHVNNVLIACCCATVDREAALLCALEALSFLRRLPGFRPNRATYPLVLRAIALTAPFGERRDSLLLREFEKCARDGFVCQDTLSELQKASPLFLKSKLPSELMTNGEEIDISKIPLEWRQNAASY